MKQFEYKTFVQITAGFFTSKITNTSIVKRKLNELGKEGWELVSVAPAVGKNGDTYSMLFTFKREL